MARIARLAATAALSALRAGAPRGAAHAAVEPGTTPAASTSTRCSGSGSDVRTC
jgi:hypothetical protein